MAKTKTYLKYIRITLIILLFYAMFTLNFPTSFIIFTAILIILIIALKEKFYKKIDKSLKKIPLFSKLNPTLKKIITVVIFILLYITLKQIIFLVLSQFGLDIQGIISETINSSVA